jgi:hypothetical protein
LGKREGLGDGRIAQLTPETDAMSEPITHPFLLNTWKHHAVWVRGRIAEAVVLGEGGVAALPAEMAVVGTRLMDLYTGPLSPAEIADDVARQLRDRGELEYEPFAGWLEGQGGYAMLDLPDGSKWAVRLGPDAGRYIHLHPGRRSRHTIRVQANTLRSAVMACALAGLTGRDPADPAMVNEARSRYLGLLPVRELTTRSGLGAVIEVLRGGK